MFFEKTEFEFRLFWRDFDYIFKQTFENLSVRLPLEHGFFNLRVQFLGNNERFCLKTNTILQEKREQGTIWGCRILKMRHFVFAYDLYHIFRNIVGVLINFFTFFEKPLPLSIFSIFYFVFAV